MKKYLLFLLLLLSGCIFVDESPNRCNSLWDPSQKDNCLLMVATQTNNISKCDEINNSYTAEQCYSSLMTYANSSNASSCERMSDIRRDDCFMQMAELKNDSSLCMRINFSYERDNCISKIAVASDRPGLCELISLNVSKNMCKNEIFEDLAVKNRDVSFCKLLIAENGSNQDMADTCMFNLAKKLNDTSYCNQIVNVFSKELCQTGKIDPASCYRIADPQGQEACLYTSAVYSNDPGQCATMASQSMKDNCYIQVAKNTKNGQLCALISSSVLKDQCTQLVQQS